MNATNFIATSEGFNKANDVLPLPIPGKGMDWGQAQKPTALTALTPPNAEVGTASAPAKQPQLRTHQPGTYTPQHNHPTKAISRRRPLKSDTNQQLQKKHKLQNIVVSPS